MNLKTDRLLIRDIKKDDLEAVHRYASNAENTLHMDWGTNSKQETKKFIATALSEQKERPRKNYELAIVLLDNRGKAKELIGGVGLQIQSAINHDASFGYILRKDQWRKGYGSEAAEAIIRFGFSKLKLHRIWATCRPENKASIGVLKKLGFSREGYLRDNKFIRGQFKDSLLYARLNSD